MTSSKKHKVILVVNIFISAFLFSGSLRRLLDIVAINHVICFSQELIDEVKEKLTKKFSADPLLIHLLDALVIKAGFVYKPKTKITVCRDPEDNYLLELAQESKADYLITGDKDLLVLKQWKGTQIIKPSQFLTVISPKK